jgi:hypothetical protein
MGGGLLVSINGRSRLAPTMGGSLLAFIKAGVGWPFQKECGLLASNQSAVC